MVPDTYILFTLYHELCDISGAGSLIFRRPRYITKVDLHPVLSCGHLGIYL
jgi:hypothetical protein